MPYIELSNEEKIMITRPTPDDVRCYEEFLRERHPMLLEAIRRIDNELARDGVDLEQLLGRRPDSRRGHPPIERPTPSDEANMSVSP